jgi:hypothetical protein
MLDGLRCFDALPKGTGQDKAVGHLSFPAGLCLSPKLP